MSEVKYPKLLWMNSRPEDSSGYTFALNAATVNEEERGFLATEQGNSLAFATGRLGVEYIPLGFIPFSGEDGVLLSVREDEVKSEIGLVSNGTYTTLINSNDLGFTLANQIQGTYTVINGCEKVIVFRAPELWAVNVDKIEDYLLTGETQTTANADGEGWDVSLMRLFLEYDRPTFASIQVSETNGSLPLGTYQVVANYLDNSLNETGWMETSLPIPITDEPYTSEFTEIDGGFNTAVPPTTKSIVVEFSNLDTSFSYLRVAVIANNDGVRTAYKIVDYPISSTSHTISITGISGEGITTIPLAEFAVSKTVYEEAQTITQTENRLIIGKPTEKQIDHAAFQQMANAIKVNWFNKELVAADPLEGNKSPSSYLDYRGYMSNEVYSLGIVVVFKDGYESPVYHIPGREQNVGFRGDSLPEYTEPNSWHNRPLPQGNWDSSLLVVGTHVDLAEVEHLGFETATDDIGYGAGYVPRWKVCNTAIKLNIPSREYYAMGDLAYWESELPYPDTVDCNGNRIFPEGNIRHHKMPDVTLVPHYLHAPTEGEHVFHYYPLGLNFSEINLPTAYSDDIAGYKIVREKRNLNNTSVFDKGLITTCLHSNYDGEELLFQPYPYNAWREDPSNPDLTTIDLKYACVHAPRLKFNRDFVGATHVKLEQKFITAPFADAREVAYFATGPSEYRSYARLQVAEEDVNYSPNAITRKIVKQAYLDSDVVLDNYFDFIFDNTEQEETYAINFNSDLPLPESTLISGGVNYPYLRGLYENTPVYFYYGGLEKYLPEQYGFLGSGAYIACSSSILTGTENQVYGGDTFISQLIFRRHARILDIGGGVADVYTPSNHDESADYIEGHLMSFFAESTINSGFRNEGTEDTEVYYPKSFLGDIDGFLSKEATLGPTPSINDDLIPNYYAYNSDFSAENDVKYFFTLPTAFDYCQDCYGLYVNRLAWSLNKNSENSMSPWRTFLANNYVDLPQDKGEITNIFVDDYKLYVQTLGSTLYVPTKYQEISSGEATLYLGTGEFMSLGGKELKSVKEGYLGSDSQWATCTTEIGTFIVSYDKIFLLSQGGAVEVSANGLTSFFLDNPIMFYSDFYNATGIEYPFKDNPVNPKGIGWTSVRDPRKKRVIFSKKDYRILFECQGLKGADETYTVGEIYWDSDNDTFVEVTTGGDILVAEFANISFWDSEYFSNNSYTLSMDLDTRAWVSFHSYLPVFMYSTRDNWYSFKDSGIWKHNSGNYRTYYGTQYPFIVEQPILQNVMQANVTNTIQFVTHVSEFDDTYKVWKALPDETFNKAWLYNDTQSSGLVTLTPFDNTDPLAFLGYTPSEAIIFRADKTWNLNSFYNYLGVLPHSSKAWADVQTDYYIDKVPVNTDFTKEQYDLERFRDGYVNCRFYYDKANNYKLLFKYLKSYDIPSVR